VVHEVPGARFRPSELPAGRVPVLFTTDWCGYCRRFYPHYARLGGGWVVDISDDDDPLWDDLQIRVVPTVILFEDGRPVARWAGALTAVQADEIAAALRGGDGSGAEA